MRTWGAITRVVCCAVLAAEIGLAAAAASLSPAQSVAATPAARGQVTQPAHTARQFRATVREYRKTIRTYPFGDPNPLPMFGRIYPYFRFDSYTNQPVDREWTVVELENAYLRVAVMPEIGGKIWSAVEKSTGRAFIYENHVVKFRDVAMRGPWTSGGIEPNYGIIGHTPNCATPVDYAAQVRPDGTAAITIGTLDLLTRTSWRLEIALPPDTSYFTTRSLWQNTSGLEQPYYTWMNTGIKAAGNLEFVFPGTKYIGHAGEVGEWPVDPANGKNLAWYDQNDFGSYKSYHVFGEESDFWGAYWHDDDFGMARYSTRDDKLGKKIWIWGLSRQGMIWEPLLTDTDGQYVEVQSGRLFNQAAPESTLTPFKHRGFLPSTTDTWTEYWMPVKQTGGLVQANALGALNVRHRPDGLDLAFSPNERISTTVDVFNGEERVRSIAVSFVPTTTWKLSLPVAIAPERLRVRIAGDRFEYSGRRSDAVLSRPVEAPREFDWTSAYGLWLKGKELIRQREYDDAERAIDAALAKDRTFLPALGDKALLRLRAGDDEAAFEAARRGLAVDTYDPQANYYYGLSASRLGRTADARDGFEVSAQSLEYRAASLMQLARIAGRAGRWHEAEMYARRSLDADSASVEARLMLATIARRTGRSAEAHAHLKDLLARDPLNHAARFEMYRLQPTDASRRAFTDGIRNELRHESFLELATWYHGLRLDDDAREILGMAPPVAEVLYWQAWLDRARPTEAQREFARADEASPLFVFPFRVESVPVFTWAMSQPNAGWKPAYYLALLERGLGNADRARQLTRELGTAPDFAPFYAFRAQLESSDPGQALADLKRAADLDPNGWRIGRLLVDRAIADGRLGDAEGLARRYYQAHPDNHVLGMLEARTLLVASKYGDALALLERLNVLPAEGSTDGRALYREAHLMLAIDALSANRQDEAERHIAAAREWPEHLGAGKPYPADTDERLEDWIEAVSLERRGARDAARPLLERIVASKAPRTRTGAIIVALALQRLGRQPESDALLSSPEIQSDPAFAAWARGLLRGEAAPLPDAGKEQGESRVVARLMTAER